MDDLDLLLPPEKPPGESWRWATVTQVSPLRVRLDGDAAALLVTPDLIGGSVAVGARVWVQLNGRRVVVHGTPGGGSIDAAKIGSGVIDYRRLGGAWTSGAIYFAATTTAPTGHSANGRWTRIGRAVIYQFWISLGAGPGLGQYVIGVPWTAAHIGLPTGVARFWDASSGAVIWSQPTLSGAATINFTYLAPQHALNTPGGYNVAAQQGYPWTWAQGDSIEGFVIYQAAGDD